MLALNLVENDMFTYLMGVYCIMQYVLTFLAVQKVHNNAFPRCFDFSNLR